MAFKINGFDETQADADDEFAYNYREDDEIATVETVKAEPPTTADRIAEAEKFFNLLFGNVTSKHFGYLWTKQGDDKNTCPFDVSTADNRKKMAALAIKLNDKGADVYIGVNLGDKLPAPKCRFTKEQVTLQTATITDIDIEGGTHISNEEKIYPPTFDVAKSFLPFDASFLVNSGYGLHGYCLYREPVIITADNRDEAKTRNEKFIAEVRRKAGRYSKAVDGVSDLPRVMRVPGTRNYKLGVSNDAPLCHVVEVNDIQFTPADIDEKLAALKPTDENLFDEKKSARADVQKKSLNDTPSTLDDDDDYKKFRIRKMLDCISVVDGEYEKWLNVGMGLFNEGMSCSDWEQWSRTQPEFKEGECESKWRSFHNDSGGITIATLHEYAKAGGYDEKSTKREWYQLHPELKTTVTHDLNDLRAYVTRKKFSLPPALRGRNNLKLTDEQRKILFAGDLSDLDFARRIEYLFGKNIRWLTDRNKWATYGKKGVWTISNEGNAAISPAATKLADMLRFNVRPVKIPADGRLTDDDIKEKERAEWELKVAEQLKRANKTAGAITKLCSLDSIRITANDLDNHPELLNCLNGVVDLQTGKLIPAAPELLLSQQVAADYQPNCRDEVVDKFFETVLPDDDTRAALFRWLGYSITGDVSEEKALFIIGSGGNGKGTMTRFLITLLNSYAASLPVSAVCEAGRFKDAGAATPELNALEKCRFAVVEELPQGVRLDVAKFKLLTGGDKIPVRRLHEEFRNILPTHKLSLSGNHLPTLNDTRDPGLLRRLMNMKFEADFTKNPDRKLKQKLSTPEALRALLSLVVTAAQDWYRDGLIESTAMKQARSDYLSDNDFISEFISEHCFRAPNASIPRKIFLSRLRTEYPSECSQLSDRALAEAVAKISDISYRRAGGGFKFFGVDFNKPTADNDDLRGQETSEEQFDLSQFD